MSTPSNPGNDSIDTRAIRLLKEAGIDLPQRDLFALGRNIAALMDPNDEITRLREINRKMVDSHNDLLTALSRTEDDAAIRIERAEKAAEDAYDCHRLIRQAAKQAAECKGGAGATEDALDQIEMLLAAAVTILDARRR